MRLVCCRAAQSSQLFWGRHSHSSEPRKNSIRFKSVCAQSCMKAAQRGACAQVLLPIESQPFSLPFSAFPGWEGKRDGQLLPASAFKKSVRLSCCQQMLSCREPLPECAAQCCFHLAAASHLHHQYNEFEPLLFLTCLSIVVLFIPLPHVPCTGTCTHACSAAGPLDEECGKCDERALTS